MRILFVDDTKDTTDMFCLCFSVLGHTVRGVYGASEALQTLELNPHDFDVAIVDYHMPGMTGLELARHIKQGSPDQKLPILLFTGHGGSDIEGEAREAGIDRVAYKPLTPEQLLTLASNVVNGAKS